jgi:hypothetical protein
MSAIQNLTDLIAPQPRYNFLSGRLHIGKTGDLGLSGNSFSFMCWVHLLDKNIADPLEQGDQAILGQAAIGSGECLHVTIRYMKPQFGFYGPGTASKTELALNTWHHLAFVYDMNRQLQTIYINGTLDASSEVPIQPLTGNHDLYYSHYHQGRPLKGLMADPHFTFRHAASQEEVLLHMCPHCTVTHGAGQNSSNQLAADYAVQTPTGDDNPIKVASDASSCLNNWYLPLYSYQGGVGALVVAIVLFVLCRALRGRATTPANGKRVASLATGDSGESAEPKPDALNLGGTAPTEKTGVTDGEDQSCLAVPDVLRSGGTTPAENAGVEDGEDSGLDDPAALSDIVFSAANGTATEHSREGVLREAANAIETVESQSPLTHWARIPNAVELCLQELAEFICSSENRVCFTRTLERDYATAHSRNDYGTVAALGRAISAVDAAGRNVSVRDAVPVTELHSRYGALVVQLTAQCAGLARERNFERLAEMAAQLTMLKALDISVLQ